MTYKRIVIGTDGSETAAVAQRAATLLAKEMGAELIVTYAVDPSRFDPAQADETLRTAVEWSISEGAETEQKCTRSPLTYTQQSCFVTGAPSGRNGKTWTVMPRSRRSGGSRKFSSTNGFALQVLTSSGLLLKPTGPNSLRFPLAPKSIPVLKSRTCTNHLEGT